MITLQQRAHLTTLYQEPQRSYHTLQHVFHCLRELREIPGLSDEQRSTLEAAIWFHDAVYDPKASKGQNEMDSAQLMYQSGLGNVSVSTVEDLIIATINHEIPVDEPEASATLMGYFLDIDLTVFGQSPRDYSQYSHQVREEYSFVDSDVYYEVRRRILVGFLARKRLYFTDHFFDKYEVQARENLSREVFDLVPYHRPIQIHEKG